MQSVCVCPGCLGTLPVSLSNLNAPCFEAPPRPWTVIAVTDAEPTWAGVKRCGPAEAAKGLLYPLLPGFFMEGRN